MMGLWDETYAGQFRGNPQFPLSQGTWIPLALFTVAQRLNLEPEAALRIVGNIAAQLNIEINESTDLTSILVVASNLEAQSIVNTGINSILMLNLSSEWNVNTDILVTGDDTLDFGELWNIDISTADMNLITHLAVNQGLLAESESGLAYIAPGQLALSIQSSFSSTLGIKYALNGNVNMEISPSGGLNATYLLPTAGPNFSITFQSSVGFPPFVANTEEFTVAGSTHIYNIPRNSQYLDVVSIGGGASGKTGDGAINSSGNGGNVGSWNSITLERGNHIPYDDTQISINIGAGGARPANSDNAGPNNGSPTIVTFSSGTLTAGAGIGSSGNQNPQSVGDYEFNGITYSGGPSGTGNGGSATGPGGAGRGGNGGIFGSRTRGGAGYQGKVWIRAYQ